MTMEMAWTARPGRRGAGVLLASLFVLALLGAGSPPAVHAAKVNCAISPGCVTLTVAPSGDGTGVVKSLVSMGGAPDGNIDCQRSGGLTSGTCSHRYLHHGPVTVFLWYLPAQPGTPGADGFVVCRILPECHPSWTEPYTFDADYTASEWGFFPWHPVSMTVTISGGGVGKVASNPVGIRCGQSGTTCSFTFPQNTVVTLRATAAAGSVFKSWMGDCAGQGAACSIFVFLARSTEAVFAKAPATPSPTSTKKPTSTAAPSRTPRPSVAAPAGTSSTAASSSPSGPSADTSPGGSSPSAAALAAVSSPQTTVGGEPAVAAGSDGGGLIALAILGAGLLIAMGIGFAGYELRRRGRTP